MRSQQKTILKRTVFMIRNVIFDFGQVLISFIPIDIVRQTVKDEQDAVLLAERFFDRKYWDKIDEGTLDGEALIEEAKKSIPERLHAMLPEIFYTWIYRVPYIKGMEAVVEGLRQKGVRLFLLSNAGHYLSKHYDHFSILNGFEACLFSAPLGLMKPHKEIYAHICNAYHLVPEETVFVDDNAANIKGANAYGINGYLFDGDAEKLQRYFDEIL